MKERFKLVPATHLLLIEKGKVLLSRRFNTGWQDGNYSLVAGHLDGNETVLQCMLREAKEEAALEIEEKDLTVVHVMHRMSSEERVDFFVQAKHWTGQPKIMEPDKCDDLQWFPLNALPENTIPYVRQALEKITKGIFYSEQGW